MISRDTFLPFALPDLGDAELEEVKSVLESGWITTGPKTHQFELEFARYVGAKHAVAVNSCTAAMHLSLEATGVQPGDFVLTTPYTFAATAEVVRYFDAIPHAHGTGAATVVAAELGDLPVLSAVGAAQIGHIALEAQEYYSDVLFGLRNVRGTWDTVNDLLAGAAGSLAYAGLLRWWRGR